MSSELGDGPEGSSDEELAKEEEPQEQEAQDVEEDAEELQDDYSESGEDAPTGELEEIESQVDDNLEEETSTREQQAGDDFGDFETEQADLSDDLDPDLGPSTPEQIPRNASLIEPESSPDNSPFSHDNLESSPIRGSSSSTPTRKSISRITSGGVQPFERRFEARPTLSPSPSSRGASPNFLNVNSRQISLLSQISQVSSQDGDTNSAEPPQAPWDVIRWTKLRKIAAQAFSEAGKRNFGRPTCVAVSALIAIGTSKGLVLGFDYHQTLKIIIGQGTKATECGSVTALTISADYSTIASGHANGNIFTWEISKPARPFLHIMPLERRSLQQNSHPDGHVAGCAVLHIGFLGTRHTALVSADTAGMAFSHLATRGLGPVTRTVITTRLLGRYPLTNPQAERKRKPSSILAFSALPLGNVEQATDSMGLTALLTPYLLVIVSTTPVAQTQFKSPRPKEISPHNTLSGCLAWFPAVKLKATSPDAKRGSSETKLVYCWSNVLTILDVKIAERSNDAADQQKPPDLEFSVRSRWRAEEAIVAVQWLGRSVLGILTVSQRLLILEDGVLQVTDSVDLLHRHLYHQDVFSHQLQAVVENLDGADSSLHGVVADAFFMSFKAYKGRVFLLGFNDLTVGTLSNWADRLVALMEAGDHIAAIRLATEYYKGSGHNISVGLAADDESRHKLVEERLLAMMSASLSYSFAQQDDAREVRVHELVDVCFEACLAMDQTEFLFGHVYESFEDAGEEAPFINVLEAYILDNEINTLPTELVMALVSHFVSENQAAKLEELLCRLDAHAFDLDQITMLCRQHSLYDSLIYVWTQALRDFVTPLIDLLTLVKLLEQGDDTENVSSNPFYEPTLKVFPYLAYTFTGRRYPSGTIMDDTEAFEAKASLYSYLFAGTPMAWPRGSNNRFHTSEDGEEEPPYPYLDLLLHFDAASLTSMLNEAFEDSFLNKRDDEPGSSSLTTTNGSDERQSLQLSRQYIIEIIMKVLRHGDFDSTQTIYFDMFIARSLPKYPGQVILSGSLLNSVLQNLCHPPSEELREECQLSVEYLLSAFRPLAIPELLDALNNAGFYRVLKTVYRAESLYNELIEVYFLDSEDKQGVFDAILFCLRSSTGLSSKAREPLKQVIMSHVNDLADIDIVLTAQTLAISLPELLMPSVTTLRDSSQQFAFLRALLEPSLVAHDGLSLTSLSQNKQVDFTELYVQLMCDHDPTHVADYVSSLPSSDLRLDQVLPAMESNGIIDAAVILLTRDGLARDAMDRLVNHMRGLEHATNSAIESATTSPGNNSNSLVEITNDLVDDIEKYTKVGLWLCQGQSTASLTQAPETQPRPRQNKSFSWNVSENDLDPDEFLWLNLVDVTVKVTQNILTTLDRYEEHILNDLRQHDDQQQQNPSSLEPSNLRSSLRFNVHQVFTVLLGAMTIPTTHNRTDIVADDTTTTMSPATTTSLSLPNKTPPTTKNHSSFLRILRTFLLRAAASSPSLASLRAVLNSIFSSYAFERGLLSLATELLDADLFLDVQAAHTRRQRGWRPRAQVCEICKRRTWGPGVGALAWDAWLEKEEQRECDRRDRFHGSRSNTRIQPRDRDRGKGKAIIDHHHQHHQNNSSRSPPPNPTNDELHNPSPTQPPSPSGSPDSTPAKLTLVVFACRHVFHRACLDPTFRSALTTHPTDTSGTSSLHPVPGTYKCPVCEKSQPNASAGGGDGDGGAGSGVKML